MTSQQQQHDLEEAFAKIEQGNGYEAKENLWEAAHCFRQAQHCLNELAATTTAGNYNGDNNDEEQQKIVQLYRSQRDVYLKRARECFIKALQQQQQQQDGDGSLAASSTISDQEAERRLATFASLFSKPLPHQVKKQVQEKQSSLEDRLSQLNASLPSGFKTSKERMRDIDRGLHRLGLSLYSRKDSPAESLDVASEEEQVADIIAQAKDEAQLHRGKEENSEPMNHDQDSDDEESDEEEESVSSIDLEDIGGETNFPNRKTIRKKIVKAQMKLAELIAWMETTQQKDLNDTGDLKDEDEEGSLQSVDLSYGNKVLKQAQRYLKQAAKDWPS